MNAVYDMFGLEVEMNGLQSSRANKYFKEKGKFLKIENVYYDLTSLSTLVNLDCFNCHRIQRPCCDGSPYEFSDEYLSLIDEKVDDIIKTCLPKDKQKEYFSFMHKYGYVSLVGYDQQKIFFNPPEFLKTFTEKDMKCFFFFKDSDGIEKCMIHRYCVLKGIDFTTLKPPSCMLFPIDVINFKHSDSKKDFKMVFAITEDTKTFSRWSSEYLEFACTNKGLGYKDMFLDKDYVPAYKAQGTSFKKLFGKVAYESIDAKIGGKRK